MIRRIEIHNFHGFASFSTEFHDRLTVIVGDNGAGKSSLLDALAIAAGGFLRGLDGVVSNGITEGDALNRIHDKGSEGDILPQYPVSIAADGEVAGKSVHWRRERNSPTGRTTTGNAKQILAIAKACQQRVRAGDKSMILPVISVYGNGRAWAQKRGTAGQLATFSRLDGYADCLDAGASETLMVKWFEKMTIQEFQNARSSPELTAVKKAISRCYAGITGFRDVKVQFNLDTRGIDIIAADGSGTARCCPMRNLSDGYRSTLSLVADIACRMAVLNPQFLDRVPDQTPGIVLIDEIELHLHPKWQQRILADLLAVFPCVQFIISTHAPCVIGSVRKENLLVLSDSSRAFCPSEEVYGSDANTVLCGVMHADERVPSVKRDFQAFYDAMDQAQLERARSILEALEAEIGTRDPELTAAQVSLDLETSQEASPDWTN